MFTSPVAVETEGPPPWLDAVAVMLGMGSVSGCGLCGVVMRTRRQWKVWLRNNVLWPLLWPVRVLED